MTKNSLIAEVTFKLKIGAKTNSNMKNAMVMVTFFVFDWKCPFLEICSKN